MHNNEDYRESALIQKKMIAKMVYENGVEAHISPAFAVTELLNVLVKEEITIENKPGNKLILSNGHVALALYAVYFEMGIISEETFYTFSKKDTIIGVHPDRHFTPGTIVSTGSLGHGLPNAIGLAYIWKQKKLEDTIFVLVGDGELNEGTIWESAIFAARMKLDNICCIIDNNRSTEYMPNIEGKFSSFGWETCSIDGHNVSEIRAAVSELHNNKPMAVIANTIKGNGVGIIEKNHAAWHHKSINKDEYEIIMQELNR